MYTPFKIGFNLKYGPYARFGYWTLISDPFAKQSSSKCEKWCPKGALSSKRQTGWYNKPTELHFQAILTRIIVMLSNPTDQRKSTVELGYVCPQGLRGPQFLNVYPLDNTACVVIGKVAIP